MTPTQDAILEAAVARVRGVTREVRVALDVNRLQALGITAAEVSRQLKQVQFMAGNSQASFCWSTY